VSRRNVESRTVAYVARRRSPWRGRGACGGAPGGSCEEGGVGGVESVERRASGGKGAAAEGGKRNAPVEGPLEVDKGHA
jgi:hypothetical protein